jgi:hypothetical protein
MAISTRGDPSGMRTTISPPSRLQVMGSRIAVLQCFGLGELGPDQMPVVWSEVLPSDRPPGLSIERSRELWRARAEAVNDVLQVPSRGAASGSQFVALGHRKCGEVGFEVHASLHQTMLLLSTPFDVASLLEC